jgi:hypothetical protein
LERMRPPQYKEFVMEQEIEKVRKAAYKTLHLIYVKYVGPGQYRLVESIQEGGVPKLTDYISFHYHESRIRVKDIGSDVIYLLNPRQFKESFLDSMIGRDPELEMKLREWYPFLWGEFTEEDKERYASILRQLMVIADIDS